MCVYRRLSPCVTCFCPQPPSHDSCTVQKCSRPLYDYAHVFTESLVVCRSSFSREMCAVDTRLLQNELKLIIHVFDTRCRFLHSYPSLFYNVASRATPALRFGQVFRLPYSSASYHTLSDVNSRRKYQERSVNRER